MRSSMNREFYLLFGRDLRLETVDSWIPDQSEREVYVISSSGSLQYKYCLKFVPYRSFIFTRCVRYCLVEGGK